MSNCLGSSRRTWSGMTFVPSTRNDADRSPVYVGITRRPMSARLRAGWTAKVKGAYYGYAMRHHLTAATLFVWYADRDDGAKTTRYLETVEAEVAYLIRKNGQWPRFQTEIHFYESNADHRNLAGSIYPGPFGGFVRSR